MSLTQRLTELVSACFTGIWIESHEHDDALAEIAQMCRQQQWRLAIWDIEQGLRIPGQDGSQAADPAGSDPLAAVRSLNALASEDSSALLVMVNAHRFLQSPEMVQALARQISLGKQNRTFVVVLAPIVQVPTEIEKLMIVVEHELPCREQLLQIAQGIATEDGEFPHGGDLERVLDAAAGLNACHRPGCGTITSDLKEAGQDADATRLNAAIDGLESLILAHACAGIDVASPAYVEGIETAVEAISNNL